MTVLQVAFAAGITAVLTGWCLYRALVTTAPSVASVYRKMYGNPFEVRADGDVTLGTSHRGARPRPGRHVDR